MAIEWNKNSFEYKVLNLKDDYEGKVISTFIKSKLNRVERNSILYIHGFQDYFFQFNLADSFDQNGYNFYALELRKCGHSLLPHQHSNFCKDISEYFEEIDNVIELILNFSDAKIVFLGHSLGGLIGCAYLNCGRKKESISTLILNSPFLEFNKPLLLKVTIPFLSRILSYFKPFSLTYGLSPSLNAKSIHKDYFGEWDFDTSFIPLDGYPVYWAWLNAVSKCFYFLRNHSKISIPILVLHSSRSVRLKAYNPNFSEVDTVLNVKDIIRFSHLLGKDLTLFSVRNAMHDILLSKYEVRNYAFNKIIEWLNIKLKKNLY